ncbi:MAG: hypothetical protein LBP68_02815, partial [Acidobacteriota bacterium]|jgi:hypothetical protein|nr:hypothetical protein [Acidobacteriota bacterium]
VRDSFFLSNHPASDLPKVVMGAAVLSIVFVFASSWLMRRLGPARMIPAGFLVSAGLHVVEYLQMQQSPGFWSLVIYFHIVALGSILLSGFWSLMNETFDPRTARQIFGRIAGFGTLGGIAGGILAERAAAIFPTSSVLLLLTAFHLLCAVVLLCIRRSAVFVESAPRAQTGSPFAIFRRAPHLGQIALMVLIGTAAAAILDYLFKAGTSSVFGKGEGADAAMFQFFSVFYTVMQVLTFLAQTFLARRVLNNKGIGSSLASLPLGVGAGALCALLLPLFPVFAIVRSLEFVLRGSLYRSAYELLYTPVPPDEKRAAKTIIDVACDRTGDAIGGGIVQLFLLIGASFVASGLLGIALALGALGAWLALRLDGSYKKLVQQRLVDRAVEFELDTVQDFTTRSVFISVLPKTPTELAAVKTPPPVTISELDTSIRVMKELRSGDILRILEALKTMNQVTPLFATQLLRLLALNEVCAPVRETLLRNPLPVTGLLIDHLINPDVEFGIRRRIPSILSRCNTPLAVEGLLMGLKDSRFEVRFQCARALDALSQRFPEVKIGADRIFAAAERELKLANPLRNSQKLLDKRSETDQDAYLDEVLRGRANQSLEYIFSLFAVVLPREPVKTAFRALHAEDRGLKGLAVEYLHSILPAEIHELLMRMVEPGVVPRESKGSQGKNAEAGQKALDELLRSHESLLIELDKSSLQR